MAHVTHSPWFREIPSIRPYSLALAVSALALGLSLMLGPIVEASHYSLLLAAVMLSAWHGGRGPGFLATGVGALSICYFLDFHSLELHFVDLVKLSPVRATLMVGAQVAVFMLVAILISWLSARQRDSKRRADLARQAAEAQARSSCQLAEAVQRELTRRAVLIRAARHLSAHGNQEQMLTELLAEAVDVLEGTCGLLARWNEAEQQVVPVCSTMANCAEFGPLRLGQGLSGRAAARRAAIVMNEYQRECGDETPAGKAGVLAAVGAPMLYDGRLVGTLAVMTDDPAKRFSPEDAEVLEILASIGAATLVGLERARLAGVLLAARTAQHELNNKLALTVGHAELLTIDPTLPPHLGRMASEALRGAQAAASILNQLHQVTRVEETRWGRGITTTIDIAASTAHAPR